MKKIYTVVFALAVMLSMAMSVAALESKTIFRQSGEAAIAQWSTPDGTTFTGLQAVKTNDGTDIFVFISTPTTFKFGSLSTQENVFNIDKRLTTATLSPVKIDLFDFNTGTVETITIQAKWTGVGDLTRNSAKFMSKSGEFMAKFSDNSLIRDATANGSINDTNLGTSDFAQMVQFRSASMTMEK